MQNNKKKIMIIGVVGLVVLLVLVGVTYAFFSYTKTGTNNVVQAGRIYFSTQETDTIGLTNAFPITRTMAATDTTNTDDLVIAITGDTTYSGGVEYLVTATDVTNTVGNKTVPISIIATVSNGVGTSDDSYFTNRGGNSSIYKVLANETLAENDELLVGYITSGATGINGTLTIKAYLDSDLIGISDTYNNGNTPTDALGTPASFGEGKVVLTTTEWNSLTGENALSFKIKVEAQEGTWVEEPVEPLQTGNYVVSSTTMSLGSTIPNDVNVRSTPTLAMADWETITGVENDSRPFYLSHTLNENNEITESHVVFIVTPEVAAANAGMVAGTYLLGNTSSSDNVDAITTAFDYANHSDRCWGDTSSDFGCFVSGLTVEIHTDYAGRAAGSAKDDENYGCFIYSEGNTRCEEDGG